MADRSIVVRLRAQADQFKQEMAAAKKATEGIGEAGKKSEQSAGSAMKRLAATARENRAEWDQVGTTLTVAGGAVLGLGAAAARTGIGYNQLQQRAGSALKILMGSASAAADQMAKLNEFASNSPFARPIFIQAQQQLLAFGVEAERVIPILSAVQDAVAATGGSNEDISELVRIIAQMSATAKITAEDLNQLGGRGIDAASIIGEQMGKSGNAIRKEITAGTLDASAAIQALTDGMSERFGGAAAGVKQTFDGALDRVKAAWRDLAAELTAPLVSPDGGGFLVDATNKAADLMRAFQKLPAPVKNATVGLVGVAGAGSALVGSTMLLVPRLMDTIDAFKRINDAAKTVGINLRGIGKAAGTAAALFALGNLAAAVASSFREVGSSSDEMVAKLGNIAATGDITADSMDELVAAGSNAGFSIKGVGDALDLVNGNGFSKAVESMTAGLLGFDTTAGRASQRLSEMDSALTTLARSGSADEFAASFRAAVESAEAYGYTAEDLLDTTPQLREVLTEAATALELEADSATLAKIAMDGAIPSTEDLAAATEGAAAASATLAEEQANLMASIQETANEFLNARDAARGYEDAQIAAADATRENGKAWEDGTPAARANAEALDALAKAGLQVVDSSEQSGTAMRDLRDDLIDTAIQMGASREEAEAYADQLGLTPETIQTQIELDTEVAMAAWDELFATIWPDGGHPPMAIDADTTPAGTSFNGFVMDVEGTAPVVQIDADPEFAEEELRSFQRRVNEAGGTVTINGDSMNGEQAKNALINEINRSDGTVTINGKTVPANQALATLTREINASDGTVTIKGNNKPANAATDEAKRKADGTTGTIDVKANTATANSAINNAARDRTSTITVWQKIRRVFSGGGGASSPNWQASQGGFASGGPVFGPGTGTSDSIPAWLSNNEHVLTAREVMQAGGHDAVFRMRAAIRAGELKFAEGGTPAMRSRLLPALSSARSSGPDVGAQVAAALSGWQPIVQIGDREMVGVMRRAQRGAAR